MKLVIDTNRIIAALIRNSSCRSIILDDNYDFKSPDYTFTEINKYKQLILKKSNLSDQSFQIVMHALFENIDVVPFVEYRDKLIEAQKLISDPKDVPFVALALSQKIDGIWSDDKHFNEQSIIKIYSTKDLVSGKF